jgi:hypothetical protein
MPVIKKTERKDGVVECLIDSSNILLSEYNKIEKTLKVTFKGGTQYLYRDILDRDYVRFEVSESQGSVFNKTMKKYNFDKLDKIDTTLLVEEIKEKKKN